MQTLVDQIQCQNTVKYNYNYFIILMGSDSRGVNEFFEGEVKTETALCSKLLVFKKTTFILQQTQDIFCMIMLLQFYCQHKLKWIFLIFSIILFHFGNTGNFYFCKCITQPYGDSII